MSPIREAIYLREGRPIDHAGFIGTAIDPRVSVVIDACAGSGKTTLLVRRIVRCLLDGASPDSILAITFTRAAAQEMAERVQAMLRRLAFDDDPAVLAILADDLMLGEAAPALLARARGLYEQVLTDRRGIELTTFHRWFWQLARLGTPAGSAEPVDELVENAVELVSATRLRWLDALHDPERGSIADAFDRLVRALGAQTTRRLLADFIDQRVDWLASVSADAGTPPALDDEVALLGAVAGTHRRQWQAWCALARRCVPAWQRLDDDAVRARTAADALLDSGLRERALGWIRLLGQGGKTGQEIAANVAGALAALDDGPGAGADPEAAPARLEALRSALTTRTGQPRSGKFGVKALAAAVAAAGGLDAVEADWLSFCTEVATLADLMVDAARALPLNRDLLLCAVSFTATFQALKRERGVIDFVDLEAVAGRMLRDEAWAALLQVRLDRRYRHLMFDEFQDTSSLQWTVIRQWLAAYAGAGGGERPGVFVVGDPKQAIYRFRRAESRVFAAATDMLRETFGAVRLTTATTRRNAEALMATLNDVFDGTMPGFRRQATLAAAGPALVWRLPRPARDAGAVHAGAVQTGAALADAALADAAAPRAGRDWLADLREGGAEYHGEEGLAIGRAILAARQRLARDGAALPWREVIVLARSRSGFAGYERALRSLAIPVVSDRRGGLLDSLEAGDLIALLQFAHAADDDLALARILRSPLIGFDAARIGRLAGGRPSGTTLIERLRDSDDEAVGEAVRRIDAWVAAARRLPVHDLLDRVLAETDAEMAYAGCVEPASREISVGNLRALVGLALDHDGGRYPGIDRFLHHVGVLERLDDKDAPDEGRPTEHDAVRLMTVHGSKGLEADLVVLADTGRSDPPDRPRLVIDWPPQAPAPQAIVFRLGRPYLGLIGRRIDEADARLDEVEDWNLLYVAATRARRGLIVSARRPGAGAGSAASWYERLAVVPEPETGAGLDLEPVPEPALEPALEPIPEPRPGNGPGPASGAGLRPARAGDAAAGAEGARTAAGAGEGSGAADGFRGLVLPPLGIGERVAPADDQPAADGLVALAAGTGLHAVLEWRGRGMDDAAIGEALAGLGLPTALAGRAAALADRVRGLPALAGAFTGAGRDEFELFDGAGRLLRIDRIVRVGDALWIIDYKWSVTPALRPAYVLQLETYREAVLQLPAWPDWAAAGGAPARVTTVLVDATAGRAEFDPR